MNIKKYTYALITLVAITTLATAIPAFADNTTTTSPNNGVRRGGMFNFNNAGGVKPIVFGTVSEVSGNTITVSGKQGFSKTATATTYTVDATNATIRKNNTAGTVASILVGDTVMIQGTASGTNVVATVINDGVMNGNRGIARPVVSGTVASINGNIITVNGKQFSPNTTNTTITAYTVDATNAKITKNNITIAIGSVIIGDTINAQGTLTGTNVVATEIRDGVMNGNGGSDQGVSSIVGNGQPVILGTVSTISGSTITITNKSNITYTVDATNAKNTEGNTTGSVSNIAVGDTVIVQGTINGTSIVASNVIDQNKPANTTNTLGTNNQQNKGFFGGIGSFFKKLFGF